MKFLWATLLFFGFAIFVSNISMGTTTFFHNRFARPPLPDLGHQTLPEVWVGHYTVLTLVVLAWVIGTLIVLWHHDHAYSIYSKFFLTMGILLIMRSFSIVVTIQPSPFGHLPPVPDDTWYWRLSYRNLFPSLGDNMFSAHTSFVTVTYLCLVNYWAKPFGWKFLLASVFFILQLLWIIASRLHYTADVIIALYLSFSLWYALVACLPFPLPQEKRMGDFVSKEFESNNKLYV